MLHRAFMRVTVALALLTYASTSFAQTRDDTVTKEQVAEAERVEPASAVAWSDEWRPVEPWEYAATFGVFAGAFYLRFAGPPPPDNWRGGILFDEVLGERARLDDPKLSGAASTMTDVLYFGSMAYRFVDAALVPWIGYGDLELAHQMVMIDLESFALVAGVMFGTQVFVGRQRPEYDDDCGPEASAARKERCRNNGSRFRSFIAGHPATVLTAAGLTCTHHSRLPLYGGWGDVLACGLSIGAAAFTGVGRVQAGKHYPSDLVFGTALGFVAGWVLPRALHYGFTDDGYYDRPARRSLRSPSGPFVTSLLPFSDGSRLGLRVTGGF